MSTEEIVLRKKLKRWNRRFVDDTQESAEALVELKWAFWRKYGWNKLQEVVFEIDDQVLRELMSSPVPKARQQPVKASVRPQNAPRRQERRQFKRMARQYCFR